jgi:hypothetical protein
MHLTAYLWLTRGFRLRERDLKSNFMERLNTHRLPAEYDSKDDCDDLGVELLARLSTPLQPTNVSPAITGIARRHPDGGRPSALLSGIAREGNGWPNCEEFEAKRSQCETLRGEQRQAALDELVSLLEQTATSNGDTGASRQISEAINRLKPMLYLATRVSRDALFKRLNDVQSTHSGQAVRGRSAPAQSNEGCNRLTGAVAGRRGGGERMGERPPLSVAEKNALLKCLDDVSVLERQCHDRASKLLEDTKRELRGDVTPERAGELIRSMISQMPMMTERQQQKALDLVRKAIQSPRFDPASQISLFESVVVCMKETGMCSPRMIDALGHLIPYIYEGTVATICDAHEREMELGARLKALLIVEENFGEEAETAIGDCFDNHFSEEDKIKFIAISNQWSLEFARDWLRSRYLELGIDLPSTNVEEDTDSDDSEVEFDRDTPPTRAMIRAQMTDTTAAQREDTAPAG